MSTDHQRDFSDHSVDSGFKRDEKDRKDTEERESSENGTASLRGKNDELRK